MRVVGTEYRVGGWTGSDSSWTGTFFPATQPCNAAWTAFWRAGRYSGNAPRSLTSLPTSPPP